MQLISKLKTYILGLSKKSKRIIINSGLSLVFKGLSVIISLLLLPAYIRFFENNEILGVWFTSVSILNWILVFDIGIGNGLRNHLVPHFSNNNKLEAKKYISSAYFIFGIIVFIAYFIGYLVIPYINWNDVFNVSKQVIPKDTLKDVVVLIFTGIVIQFYLRLVNSVFRAMLKPVIPGILSLLANIFLLCYLLLTDSSGGISNIKKLAIINLFAFNIPLFIATIIVFLTKLKGYAPNFRLVHKYHIKNVVRLGSTFFWLQIMTMLIFNTNEFLITWFVAPEKVVDYQIYNKIFTLISTLFRIALMPVWSEVTEANSKNNFLWIKSLYKKLKQFWLIAIIGELILVFLFKWIIKIWLGEGAVDINVYYVIAFAIVCAINMWISANANITAGLSKLKTQIIFLTIGALLNIPIAYLLVQATNTWIGIVLANIISMVPYCIIQPIVLNKYFKTKIKGNYHHEDYKNNI